MDTRDYAVLLAVKGRITKTLRRRLSLSEAVAFARSYNRIDDDHLALLVRHPISRAISKARPKSRSS